MTEGSIDERARADAPPADFDEAAFLKRSLRRSRLRGLGLSAAVVVVAMLLVVGAYVGWATLIAENSNRIAVYQPVLVSLSQPNTFILGFSDQLVFPGARDTFVAYRPVGSRPMPRGVVTVDLDVWRGEVSKTEGGRMPWAAPAREFTGSDLAPALRFLSPAAISAASVGPGDGDYLEQVKASFADQTLRSRSTLAAAPPSATAEVALSFGRGLTLQEVQTLIGRGVTLNWGAVDVWSPGRAPIELDDGQMVGVSFVGADGAPVPILPSRLQGRLVDDLHLVAKYAPKGTSDRCTATARFLEKNGISYYGAVVTAPVALVRPLLTADGVSAAVLGFVVQPWD